MAPPTLAYLAFAVAQTGVLLLLRDPLTRWLARPRVWRSVIIGGAVAMTAFLWHFTALIGIYAILWLAGVDMTDVPTGARWWAIKGLLLIPFLGFVVLLVMVFRRFDRPPPRVGVVGHAWWRATLAALSAACATIGMLGFAMVGFRGVVSGYTGAVAGIPMTTLLASGLVAASAVLAALAVRGRDGSVTRASGRHNAPPHVPLEHVQDSR